MLRSWCRSFASRALCLIKMSSDMVLPADWVPGPEQGSWTYDDYASLPDDGQRYEIVNGVLVMAPAPDGPHQDAVLRIAHYLLVHIEFVGLGKVRVAPFDVELSSKNVFQPDVFIVLNAHLSRMQKKKMIGTFRGQQTLPSRIVSNLLAHVEQFFS